MNKSNVLTKTQQFFAVVLAVVLSLLVVWGAAFGATTISNNVSTGGTLTVSGLSTLTGFISNASSTVKGTLFLTGGLNASSTATTTAQSGIDIATGCFSISGTCIGLATSSSAANSWSGLQTFTGTGVLLTASTTVTGQFMVYSPLQASSTLLVAGLSNLTGFISNASSTVSSNLNVTGQLQASTTLVVTGASTLYGNLNVNGAATTTAATGDFTLRGALSASSTMSVAGVATFYGNKNYNGNATTTAASGNFATVGTIVASSTSSTVNGIGVATSTPAAEFAASGSATTTLHMTTTKAVTGGCIQLRATNGTMYRMYIAADDIAERGTTSASGHGTFAAVWEAGSC